MNLTVIRKRNGKIVPFDSQKIVSAVSKAFLSVTGKEELSIAENIKDLTLDKLFDLYKDNESSIPYVEQVQDLVEQSIMDAGYFDIAKHYILYRHERALKRAQERQEELKKIEEGNAIIINRGGVQTRFNENILREFIKKMIVGYESTVSIDAIVDRVKNEIYDGISAEEFTRAIVLSCRSMIEVEPSYSYVAARIVRYLAIKEMDNTMTHDSYTDESVKSIYTKYFVQNIQEGVDRKIYSTGMKDFDLEKLAQAINPENDFLFEYLGMQVVYDRYLVRDLENKNKLLELPQMFWMRVAMGLALLEENKNERAIEFYKAMSALRIIPSTPTLFHSGLVYSQLSSCFLNTVDDDLHHIFKVYSDNAQLSKYSGGVATDWTNIRSSGAIVKKTRIESNGVIPFLKIANDVTVTINRSGRRRGAVCVYLETWHYDIEEFLELRKNTGDERRRTHDMNTANWVPDLFMERVKYDGDWTLFSPDEVPDLHHIYGKAFRTAYENYEAKAKRGEIRVFKVIKAKDLYRKMIMMLYETGHPWITFKDAANIRSPQDHDGVVHCSNLCTEITLNNNFEETAVCNLASLNLPRYFVNGKIDLDLLKDSIHTAMRMLDNTIENNFYPTQEGKTANYKHRPVGLGIMGFHDALYELGFNFDSPEALRFADENQEFISYQAILASSLLAKERGPYQTFKGSKWDRGIFPVDTLDLLEQERGIKIPVNRSGRMDWTPVRESVRQYGMRNSNCMALAPTATISNIAGSSPTIEPYYKNIYVKSNMSGEFTYVNTYLVEDLKKLGLWDMEMLTEIKMNEGSVQNISRIPDNIKAKYKETFELPSKVLIDIVAYRGKWIDQSQSFNLFYKGTSGKDIAEMYQYVWEMGIKTTYYLRTLAASGVEKATTSIKTTEKAPEKKDESIPSPIPSYTTSPSANIASAFPTSIVGNTVSAVEKAVTETINPSIKETLEKIVDKVDDIKESIVNSTTPIVNVMQNTIPKLQTTAGEMDPKTGAGTATIMVNGKEIKISKVLDPDCEACQ